MAVEGRTCFESARCRGLAVFPWRVQVRRHLPATAAERAGARRPSPERCSASAAASTSSSLAPFATASSSRSFGVISFSSTNNVPCTHTHTRTRKRGARGCADAAGESCGAYCTPSGGAYCTPSDGATGPWGEQGGGQAAGKPHLVAAGQAEAAVWAQVGGVYPSLRPKMRAAKPATESHSHTEANPGFRSSRSSLPAAGCLLQGLRATATQPAAQHSGQGAPSSRLPEGGRAPGRAARRAVP